MPFDISIDSNSFDSKAWEASCLTALQQGSPIALLPFSTHDRLLPSTYLLPAGGLRGVWVSTLEDGTIELSVPSPASEADLGLARWLGEAAKRAGATVRDDGDLISAEADDVAWAKLHRNLWAMIQKLKEDGGGTLVGPLSLRIDQALAEKSPPEIEATLVAKIDRYGRAFRASSMHTEKGPIIGCYAFIDTLIRKEVTHIMYDPHGGTSPCADVPIESMKAKLGESVVDLGDYVMMPGFDTSTQEGKARLAALNAGLGINPSDFEKGPELTEQQCLVLRCMPYLTFIMVGAADGEIDDKEYQAFLDRLEQDRATTKDPIFRRLLPSSKAEHEHLCRVAKELWSSNGPKIIAFGNRTATEVLGDAWEPMRSWLLGLGKSIAEASGGGWFRSKVGSEEKRALEILAQALAPIKTA